MNKYFVPLCDSLEMLRTKIIESYSPVIPIAPQLVSQSVSEMQQRIDSLISEKMLSPLIEGIEIHHDYVGMPEALIPDGFSYIEVGAAGKGSPILKAKKLSFSDAMSLLTLLATIFFGITQQFNPMPTKEQMQEAIQYLSVIASIEHDIMDFQALSDAQAAQFEVATPDSASIPEK